MSNDNRVLGVITKHLAAGLRGPPGRHRKPDPTVVRALAAVGPASRQARNDARDVMANLASQNTATKALRFSLRHVDYVLYFKPHKTWWPNVLKVLGRGADPNAAGPVGNTLLMMGAAWNNLEVVNVALAAGANADLQNKSGETALILAAAYGREGIVVRLLAAGANADLQKKSGETALIKAALHGREGIVARLLAAKADPNVKNTSGNTALILAARNGEEGIVVRLLAAGAIPYLRISTLTTPAIQAMVDAAANARKASKRDRRTWFQRFFADV